MLATIYAFLEKHDLLSLFPEAEAPTIERCVTWTDPLSEEAEKKRQEMSEQEEHNQLANKLRLQQQQDHATSKSPMKATAMAPSFVPASHIYGSVPQPYATNGSVGAEETLSPIIAQNISVTSYNTSFRQDYMASPDNLSRTGPAVGQSRLPPHHYQFLHNDESTQDVDDMLQLAQEYDEPGSHQFNSTKSADDADTQLPCDEASSIGDLSRTLREPRERSFNSMDPYHYMA
jgi:hypothetical protein